MDNCDCASAIQSSQEINSAPPPRLWACDFSVALTRKFWSDLSNSERNRPRLRSAWCNLLFFASVGGGKDKAPAGSYKLARSIFTPVASLPVHERTCGFSLFYTSNKRRIRRATAVACLRADAKFAGAITD